MTVIVVALLASLVSACGTGSTDPQSACDTALAQAMAIDPASDTVEPVDGAIAGCASVEAWVAAAQKYPDAFGGQDPATLARERCAASPQLAATPVCVGLSGN
jgi:hypothetical protein